MVIVLAMALVAIVLIERMARKLTYETRET
jgi:hypothetical protein